MKIIRIAHCSVCHYRDYKEGFGKISCIPYCKWYIDKTLPYKTHTSKDGMVIASVDVTAPIPDWCPLEDLIK